MSNQPKLGKPGGAKRVAEHFESIREECRTSVQESSENYTEGIEAETNVNRRRLGAIKRMNEIRAIINDTEAIRKRAEACVDLMNETLLEETCEHTDGTENGHCNECGAYVGLGLPEYEVNDER